MDDLSGVKAGDKLYIKRGHYDVGRIATVDRVTAGGRLVVGSQIFEKNGRLRGGDTWSRTWAYIATQEHADKIEQESLAYKLSHAKWHEMPLAVLRRVNEILAQGIEARRVETSAAQAPCEAREPGPKDAP